MARMPHASAKQNSSRRNPVTKSINPLQSAFTLVELLIAMTLGVIVLAVSSVALQSGFSTWRALSIRDNDEVRAIRLLHRMELDIASSHPIAQRGLRGDATSLLLSRRAPPNRGTAPQPPIEVIWLFEPSANSIIRRERALGDPDAPWTRDEVFDNIRAFRLSYAPPPAAIDSPDVARAAASAWEPVWQSAWGSGADTGLPLAVRAELPNGVSSVMPSRLGAASHKSDSARTVEALE